MSSSCPHEGTNELPTYPWNYVYVLCVYMYESFILFKILITINVAKKRLKV